MAKPPTYKEFFTDFPDDDACLEHLMRVRYGDRHECQRCWKPAQYYRVRGRQAYACEHCGRHVYPRAGTPFERSRTSLHSWFFAMFLFCTSRNGVSAKELQRQLGVTYKTAWRMARLIREYMGEVDGDSRLGGPGMNLVEADKAFIGGKDKLGQDDKTIVLGMVERGGEIVTRVIPDRREITVTDEMLKAINQGARVATDEAKSFRNLKEYGFHHAVVNHSKKEYVRGDVHTNTIEGFWNLFKGAYRGTYVHVAPKYLQTYLYEFAFRWNLRKAPQLMFPILLQAFSRPARHGPYDAKGGRIAF